MLALACCGGPRGRGGARTLASTSASSPSSSPTTSPLAPQACTVAVARGVSGPP